MKFFKTKFFIIIFSFFISIIFLIIFKPILTAKDFIFPYSVHPFNIAKNYPKVWFYIKIVYCINLFIANFLVINSIHTFFKINKNSHPPNIIEPLQTQCENNFKLLIGLNSKNKENVYITEKGLYQNILVTGTIGSRQNEFSDVSSSQPVNEF